MSPSALEATAPAATLRVVIVDDEPLARDCMRLALQHAPDVEIVAECSDGIGAVDAIRRLRPDLVFLDVQMPGLDGFGVIERLGAASVPPVVFVTAYDVHAIRAFEVHAVDYVLKPFDDARFLDSLERARSLKRDRQHGELGRKLAEMVRGWYAGEGVEDRSDRRFGMPPSTPASSPVLSRDDVEQGADSPADDAAFGLDGEGAPPGPRAGYISRFAVRSDGRVRFVAVADVDWIEASGNYAIVHVGEVQHRIRASLRDVSQQLDPRTFVRIHRSAIVNIDRIREVQPWFGGDYVAILRTGAKLKVSRMRASQLLRPMA
jgi:two-component system, LytTR family, response regulator